MGLREKIFLAFFIIVTLLLGVTLYYTNTQTTKFELARIIGKLQNTQGRFLDKFETEREAALKLVGTITSDQKYRSFLQQARDNYYPFAEEIGLDTKADLVFVVGEDMAVLGTYPLSKSGDGKQVRGKQIAWVMERVEEDHVNGLLGEILDNGKSISRVLSFGGLLMNTINVPLKESLSDDYALGVVSVSFAINDDWVKQLLKDESPEINGVFHLDGKPVAANIPMARSGALLDAAMAVPGGKGFEFEGERFIMLHDAFAKAGRPGICSPSAWTRTWPRSWPCNGRSSPWAYSRSSPDWGSCWGWPTGLCGRSGSLSPAPRRCWAATTTTKSSPSPATKWASLPAPSTT